MSFTLQCAISGRVSIMRFTGDVLQAPQLQPE